MLDDTSRSSDTVSKERVPTPSSSPGSGDGDGARGSGAASPMRTRWQRSRNNESPPPAVGGWRTVRKRTRTNPQWKPQDEWNVPIREKLQMNTPGLIFCEDETAAKEILSHVQGTNAPTAILTRQRIPLSPYTPDRVAFHLSKKVGETETVMASVGYIYQLNPTHSVALKRMPQTTTLEATGSTVVLRLVCSQTWTPEPVWESLLKGKIQKLRDELVKLLQEQHPSQVHNVQDVFKMELKGRTVSCCVRVARAALKSVLSVSGQQWLFCHTLSQQTESYPVVWTQEGWPELLKPIHTRATDIQALGLALGDRHIGYRCEASMVATVRNALGITPRNSWIVAGIPVAFSVAEANDILSDLNIAAKVLDHTRRVNRVTQSWVFHLPLHVTPVEDTMHLVHQERDYYVTVTPAAARNSPTQVVKELTRPARKQEPKTYAQAAAPSSKAPEPAPKSRTQDQDRIAHLENLISLLIKTLQNSGAELPAAVKEAYSPPEAPSDDSESDSDQYMGDGEDWPPPKASAKLEQQSPKRPKVTSAPQDKFEWKHANPSPFSHVVWGRVKGDGNCYWRSLALVTGRPWNLLKQEILARAPALSDAWCQYFKCTTEEYQRQVAEMLPPDAWAGEIAIALASLHLEAPVIVVASPQVWVASMNAQPTMPIILKLEKGHFSPIKQKITNEMITAMQQASQVTTSHLSLKGGATHAMTLSLRISVTFPSWEPMSLLCRRQHASRESRVHTQQKPQRLVMILCGECRHLCVSTFDEPNVLTGA